MARPDSCRASDPDLPDACRNREARSATLRRRRLAAGTSWLWAHEDLAASADVLFVDEAGQFSLANTLAVAQAAGSLVLLGDPQQLEQPIKGVHPDGAGVSALEHLLDGAATIPREQGLFLARTWRLHPDLCEFTSEQFYEGNLKPQQSLNRQIVHAPAPFGVPACASCPSSTAATAITHPKRPLSSPVSWAS